MSGLVQDLRYAARLLARSPGFTAVVIVVLGTVIGLNTSLFTVLAGLARRGPSGVKDPSRVVELYLTDSRFGRTTGFSLAEYRFLAGHTKSLIGPAAMQRESVRLGVEGALGNTDALLVTGNFFEVLGVVMARGRGFLADDDRAAAPQAVAVLGHGLWESRFGADPDIVGRSVRINDVPFTVVGIASRDFVGLEPGSPALFVPIAADPLLRPNDPSVSSAPSNPDECCWDVVGRLVPGATREQARAELDLLSRRFRTLSSAEARSVLVTGTEFMARPDVGRQKNVILAMFGLVSTGLMLVWLLACANVGNLMLARAAARGSEIGIRLSLGASRGRVVRQLLTEGCVLALAASALGVGVAYELPPLLFRLLGDGTPAPFGLAPDGVVLGYTVLLAGLSLLASGLVPALHATRSDIASALKARDGLPASRFPLRSLLLGVQVAVSVVLLVSAGLLVRGVQRHAGAFDPGFAVDDVTVVSFEAPAGAYDEVRTNAFLADLTEALRELPPGAPGAPGAIDAFGFTTQEPFSLARRATLFQPLGETSGPAQMLMHLEVSPGFLEVLGIPLVAGRNFGSADAARPVVLINESMARRYWPNENAVGKTFFVRRQPRAGAGLEPREIVGVVPDVYTIGLSRVGPEFYEPLSGRELPKLLLRTSDAAVSSEIARTVARLDPRVRIRATAVSAILDSRMKERRYGPMLAGALGTFALLLATLGMFGVFAYAVRQRTREIGIRMALGAPQAAVVRLVLAAHSRAVLVGLFVGLLGAVAASMILRSRLHGLSPFDPIAYVGVAALLTVAGLAATYVPARRAARVDPLVALRYE